MKALFTIYGDVECLLEKMYSSRKTPKKSLTEKKTKPSGYSLFTNCSFDMTKSKLHCNKDKNCLETFCKDLKEHAIIIINYEKKEMILLTDKEDNSYKKQKTCYI